MSARRYIVEVHEQIVGERLTCAVVCLGCSQGFGDMLDGHAFTNAMWRLNKHTCTPGREGEHWLTVVRDAFLEGHDQEAIKIICKELNLVPVPTEGEMIADYRIGSLDRRTR